MDLVKALPDGDDSKPELLATQDRLMKEYNALSDKYHNEKEANPSNSLVLGWTQNATETKSFLKH